MWYTFRQYLHLLGYFHVPSCIQQHVKTFFISILFFLYISCITTSLPSHFYFKGVASAATDNTRLLIYGVLATDSFKAIKMANNTFEPTHIHTYEDI